MPFRCLSYVAELLNNLVVDKDRLYHKALIRFPRPKFFVFYDGDEKEPLQREMRLSDAFNGDGSTLVGKVKEGIRAGLTRKEAISRAVRYCLDNGLMKGYLEENSKEVFNMLALQWEQDKAIRASYEDGRDEGIESVALNLLNIGLTVEKIQEATKLSFERIKELSACISERR